jgi:hypothetical protein
MRSLTAWSAATRWWPVMSEGEAPTRWRVVQVLPGDEGTPLAHAIARVLNDNSASSKRVLARLEAVLGRLLARGVPESGGRSRPEAAPGTQER